MNWKWIPRLETGKKWWECGVGAVLCKEDEGAYGCVSSKAFLWKNLPAKRQYQQRAWGKNKPFWDKWTVNQWESVSLPPRVDVWVNLELGVGSEPASLSVKLRNWKYAWDGGQELSPKPSVTLGSLEPLSERICTIGRYRPAQNSIRTVGRVKSGLQPKWKPILMEELRFLINPR